jgi:hypothetical protein
MQAAGPVIVRPTGCRGGRTPAASRGHKPSPAPFGPLELLALRATQAPRLWTGALIPGAGELCDIKSSPSSDVKPKFHSCLPLTTYYNRRGEKDPWVT